MTQYIEAEEIGEEYEGNARYEHEILERYGGDPNKEITMTVGQFAHLRFDSYMEGFYRGVYINDTEEE